jgi:predicted DNA-binding transcriptional regulator YafY
MYEIKFTYKNYKGEISERTVEFQKLEYIARPGFGYKPSWFLTGLDKDRNEIRSFDLGSIVVPLGSSFYTLMEIKP